MRKTRRIISVFCCFLWSVYGHLSAQTAADSLAIVSARWECHEVGKGIVHKKMQFGNLYGGPQNVNILQVDLRKGRKIDVAAASGMQRTSELAVENEAMAVINASFFNMQTGASVCFYEKEGVRLHTTTEEWVPNVTGAMYVKKGKLKIYPWDKQTEQAYHKKKGVTLASGPLLLVNGKECAWQTCNQSFVRTKHPRSAVALMDKGLVLLVTVDGRFPNQSRGMSVPELAHFLRIFGAKNALNLDGGGSTTLWVKNGQSGVLNCPCDNGRFDHAGERKVGNILYVK